MDFECFRFLTANRRNCKIWVIVHSFGFYFHFNISFTSVSFVAHFFNLNFGFDYFSWGSAGYILKFCKLAARGRAVRGRPGQSDAIAQLLGLLFRVPEISANSPALSREQILGAIFKKSNLSSNCVIFFCFSILVYFVYGARI